VSSVHFSFSLLLLSLTAEKKESFATTLKKRLTRGKKRSQSAERPAFASQSLREGTYLRPPDAASSQTPGGGSNTLGTEQTVYTVGTD